MAQVRSKKATRVPKTRATRAASGASKPRSGPAPSGAGRRRWTMLFAEGNATMRDLLGGKGAGLAEMSRIGLPVPPGFTITTEACLEYYRRFMQMFGNVVLGLKHELFEDILLAAKRARGVTQDTELSAGDLGALTEEYRRLVRERAGQAFPEDPWQQLEMAIHAVFESWNN